jgi:glycosyltransferase involved in cell wall biosynthesis
MKKNTLYISFDGLSDPLGQSQIIPYLTGIAEKEYHITILSCEKLNKLNQEKNVIEEKTKHLPITWKFIPYKEDGSFLLRIVYIFKLYFLAKNICNKNKIELIHCRSYLSSLIGLRLKRKMGIPFIFDMRGFWADERFDGKIWNIKNPLHKIFYKYFKKKEIQFLQNASAIISLTHAGLEELDLKFPQLILKTKTTVIPCCTDTNLFSKQITLKKISSLALDPEDFIIIYTGSIGTWYYTKEMIDCMLTWKTFIPKLKLLILTKDQESLSRILANYTHEDLRMIKTASASYNEVVDYLSLAKAAIFFIMPSYSKIASSPTKMAECWALDLPIITNQGIGDNDLYFNKHKGGVLINTFSKENYIKAYDDFSKLNQKSNHFRQIALDFFDSKMAIQKYLNIYRTIAHNSN